MAITGFRWDHNQGFDIHVLRNNLDSSRLDEIAVVNDSAAGFASVRSIEDGSATKPSDYSKIEFIPRFISAPNAAGNHVGNGIEVNVKTGEINAAAQAAPKIRYFVFDAKLSRTGQPVLTISIRVHVHNDIVKAWLTPSTLTIRPGLAQIAAPDFRSTPSSRAARPNPQRVGRSATCGPPPRHPQREPSRTRIGRRPSGP